MSFKCKVCGKEFETERKLHAHLKAHSLRVAAYYQQCYPRYDLYDGKIIKFKSKKFYFEYDFNSRSNLIKWLDKQPKEEARKYLKDKLEKRVREKGIVYAPSQVEMRSVIIPSIVTYEKFFNFYELCSELNLKNKYKLVNNIVTGSAYSEMEDVKVYVDTREQKPLKFEMPMESKALKFGDYALSNKDLTCNCYIERKSLADFISTISVLNFERFKREVERAGEAEANLVVVVEDSLQHALSFPFLPYISKKIKATPEFIFHNVRALIQEYPHLQFLFVDGRKESVRVIEKIFFSGCLYKDIDLQLAYDKKIL